MPKALYQLFFFIHRLSFDVALGACAMMYLMLQFVTGVDSPLSMLSPAMLPYTSMLFLGTLMVYWTDHIQDSEEPLLVQPGMRHMIFKTYRSLFLLLIALFFVTEAFLAFHFLNGPAMGMGAILCFLLFVYLSKHRGFKRKLLLEKEVLISSLYTISIIFIPIMFALHHAHWLGMLLVLGFLALSLFFTVLQNLFSIALIEKENDARSNIRSIAAVFGSNRLRLLQAAMLLSQVILSAMVYLLSLQNKILQVSVCLLLISLINFALPYLFKNPQNNWYRILGDGVFLLGFLVA